MGLKTGAGSIMAVPELPPVIEIAGDTKKAVIDGLKRVITAYQDAGLLPPDATYQSLISDADLLYKFIQVFNEHRDVADMVVKAKEGGKPVRDDDQTLVCGVSLNQIQHLLVKTCARKSFEHDIVMETVSEKVTKKSFFFFTKSEDVEVQRQSTDPVEERKAREISKYMAYAWQLPLIEPLRKKLNSQQIMELGDSLIALQSVKAIETVAHFDGATLKKAKVAAGQEFKEVLANQPRAVRGIAIWNQEMYDFYRKLLGDHAWKFFARDTDFFNVVVALDKTTAKIMSYMLCYISLDNLLELQRLNVDKTEVMVASLTSAFGNDLPAIMANSDFGKEFLRKMVDNLLHMSQEKNKLLISYGITCKSMVSTVHEWMVTQHHTSK